MHERTNTDNIYKEGTIITAKVDPNVKLIILKYYHRIYYCAVDGDPGHKNYAYFERELIPPTVLDQQQYTRMAGRLDVLKNNAV